jgi:hypothetical protein
MYITEHGIWLSYCYYMCDLNILGTRMEASFPLSRNGVWHFWCNWATLRFSLTRRTCFSISWIMSGPKTWHSPVSFQNIGVLHLLPYNISNDASSSSPRRCCCKRTQHFHSSTFGDYNSPAGLWCFTYTLWHISQSATYSAVSRFIPYY